jgi:hypothetical protein
MWIQSIFEQVDDITRVEYLHVEADPSPTEQPEHFKERQQPIIDKFKLQPASIIDSGNCHQLLWRLQEPIEVTSPDVIEVGRDPRLPSSGSEKGIPKALVFDISHNSYPASSSKNNWQPVRRFGGFCLPAFWISYHLRD